MNISSNNWCLRLIILGIVSISISKSVSAQTNSWQQKVDTRLDVVLDDVNHILKGTIDMDYYNNSPDTLNYIYFHLWPNAYSHDLSAYNKQAVENGNTKFYLADKTDWGYIDSLQFNVDNVRVTIESTDDREIIKLMLPTPLLPGQSINIFSPFYLQIPQTFSRLGHEGQSYQFTQWFPKPAVYDQNGWNTMPYLDQGEFFSEFGTYDVQITLPKNYIVIATGNLETPSEIQYMDSLAAIDHSQHKYQFDIPSDSANKTIRFTESNIHDFAWFADKRWILKKGQVTIPQTGNEVTLWSAYYPNHQAGWSNSIEYLAEGLRGFSEKVGPYPYQTVKAVEGPLIAGGGMEYPTVTIIIPSNDSLEVREIIIHEVGHNWFYGILANNERLHPWMDESINSHIENEIVDRLTSPIASKGIIDIVSYGLYNAGGHSQAVHLPATSYRANNYGIDIYQRGAKNFEWLQAYIGTDTFKQILNSYYTQYKFKHVYPEDFENVFRSGTSKSLDWFFGPAMQKSNLIDFSIKNITNNDESSVITIKNKGKDELPAIIEVTQVAGADTLRNLHSTPAFKGMYSLEIEKMPNYSVVAARIHKSVPDSYEYNNYHRNGRTSPLKFIPFFSTNTSNNYIVNYLPSMAYNIYDGFQLGAMLHNITVPKHQWQFAIAPMYGFGSKQLTGVSWLSYTTYPSSRWIQSIEYGLGMKRFGYRESNLNIENNVVAQYTKISPEIFITFKRPTERAPVYRTFLVKPYFIYTDVLQFKKDPSDDVIRPSISGNSKSAFLKLKYNYENYRTFNPYSYTLDAQFNSNFIKVGLEGKLRVDYHYKNSALYIRGFIGKLFEIPGLRNINTAYYFTTGYGGRNDYLYDDYYFGRNASTGIFSRQVSMKEGGFKITTPLYAFPLGYSNDWFFALNLKSDLPIRLPIKVYFDMATFTNAQQLNPSGAKMLWDAGFEIDLKFMQVYLPILHSKDFTDYLTSIHGKQRFLNSISFSIPINNFRISQPIESHAALRKMILN